MTEQTQVEREKQSTPFELADSWLSYRATVVQKEIDETQASRSFTENYEMKPLGPRPSWVEPGGLDASDWDIAEGEYNQWPEEKEEELDYLDGELRRLEGEYATIRNYRGRIGEGDTILIEELAGYEKERREKLEKRKQEIEEMERIYAEKKAGKEMDGVLETESVLRKLIDLVQSGSVPEDKPGNNGWELARKWNNNMHDYIKNHFQIEFRLKFAEATGVHVEIKTYPGPILPYEKREKGRVDIGESIDFTLKEGKIYDWNKTKAERSYQWGYPDRRRGPSDELFDQSDFDSARNVISELYSDLESLSSK